MKRRTLLKSMIAAPLVAFIPSALAVAAVSPEFAEITPRVADPDHQGWQIVEYVTHRKVGKGGGVDTRTDDTGVVLTSRETEYNYFAVHPDHSIAFNLKDTGNRIDVDDLDRRYQEVLEWKRLTRDEKEEHLSERARNMVTQPVSMSWHGPEV